MNINRDVYFNDYSFIGFLYGFFFKRYLYFMKRYLQFQLMGFYCIKNIWEVFIDLWDFIDLKIFW